MKIDNNELELESMEMFRCGDKKRAHELEDEFIRQFRESKRNREDHCSCPVATCKHHGRCMECVAIHRGHRDHLPNCLHDMVNEKLRKIVSVTESSLNEFKP
ncbi:hypothetical protein [Breznakiella homolactica]|uniref:LPS biosynthesis protein n=1 Tax=Breznakiella homolactica TaxID=2798577 RepID=A0A7T7XLA9_9SPIR|nr:hypothetical protein [Breznakiella homolactica]QQO08499.1 hypothetical protein JFL75_16410 [Breznakiella homolactica]